MKSHSFLRKALALVLVLSSLAALTALPAAAASKPVITAQPTDVTVAVGKTAEFTVAATGADSFQWQYKAPGGSWKSVSAASGKTANYSLTAQTRHDGYQYRVKVKNAAGTTISAVVTLTVQSKPVITAQPTDVTVAVGQTAKFTVAADGADSFQWQYKIPGGSWKSVSAASGKTAAYSLKTAERHNGYQYRCKVKNAAGTTISSAVTLTVSAGKPVITSWRFTSAAEIGQTASFTVEAEGATAYQWQYKAPGGSWKSVSAASGKTATYTLTVAARHDGYLYRCKVKNAAGTVITNTMPLAVVIKPVIMVQPENVSAAVGEKASFTVLSAGAKSYQWQYKAPGGSWKSVSAASGKTANYSLTVAERHDGYLYRCKLTNDKGTTISAVVSITVRPAAYTRGDDAAVYDEALGEFAALMAQAGAASDLNERYVRYAKAEAALLDSAVVIPTTTQNGAYTISRVAPHTVPFAQWGSDDSRYAGMVISDEFISKEERADLLALWERAVAGEGSYDPAAYLTGKGHTLRKEYTSTFSTQLYTLDWLGTAASADTEILVNLVDGLVQYDNLGRLCPALAQSWEISADGLTYTFHLRSNAYWYRSDGSRYAAVCADDFVAGFRHMLARQAGMEWMVDGVVAGASEYLGGSGTLDDVGIRALDAGTLGIRLAQPTPWFMTMLGYSCFLPVCAEFLADSDGSFGDVNDLSSQLYCGPFLPAKIDGSEMLLVANPDYYNAAAVSLTTLRWYADNGENPAATYDNVVAGIYPGVGLGEASGTLALAKADGNFDKYAYISDTTATTYFGGLNLNRGTFALANGACPSPKTEDQKIDAGIALRNQDFRKALQFAFDKAACNAVSRGEELKCANLRNTLTAPDFVVLSADVTLDGKTFPAGTLYGNIVQYYLDQRGCPVKTDDGIDGWYNPEAARAALARARTALGGAVRWPIQIDVVYYAPSDSNTAQARAYKDAIEGTLGAENVVVNLVAADNSNDFYAAGYRAPRGVDADYDMFYGSGWGPDYGDPSTYLNIFLGNGAGYLTRVLGLY